MTTTAWNLAPKSKFIKFIFLYFRKCKAPPPPPTTVQMCFVTENMGRSSQMQDHVLLNIQIIGCKPDEFCNPAKESQYFGRGLGYVFLSFWSIVIYKSFKKKKRKQTDFEISLVFLLSSNLINKLHLHQFLGTKITEVNKSLKNWCKQSLSIRLLMSRKTRL